MRSIKPLQSACTMTSCASATAWTRVRPTAIFAAGTLKSTRCCAPAGSRCSPEHSRGVDYAGYGSRRFEAHADSAQCTASILGDARRFAAVLPHARHVFVELASSGLSAHRGHRLGEVFLLRSRIHPGPV